MKVKKTLQKMVRTQRYYYILPSLGVKVNAGKIKHAEWKNTENTQPHLTIPARSKTVNTRIVGENEPE